MRNKILPLSILILLISTFGMFFLKIQLHFPTYVAMSLFTVVSIILWYLFLKKDLPITYTISNTQTLRQSLLLVILPITALSYFASTGFNSLSSGVLLYMLISSLAVGIYEEFLFRGIVFGSLLKSNITPKRAVLYSAILFSLFHLVVAKDYAAVDIALKLFNTFILGVILAYLYYAVGSIFYVIFIHTLWDLVSSISQEYPLDDILFAITLILFAMSILYTSWSLKRLSSHG